MGRQMRIKICQLKIKLDKWVGLPQCGGHAEFGQDPGPLTSHAAAECPTTSQEKGHSRQNHPLSWKALIWNQNLFLCILESGQSPTQMQSILPWLLPPHSLLDVGAYRRHGDVPLKCPFKRNMLWSVNGWYPPPGSSFSVLSLGTKGLFLGCSLTNDQATRWHKGLPIPVQRWLLQQESCAPALPPGCQRPNKVCNVVS